MRLGVYQHFKGNYYQVIGIAKHSETLEDLVVYQALYPDYGLWVRPLLMFNEYVVHEGQSVPRFRYISSPLLQPPAIHEEKHSPTNIDAEQKDD